MKEIVIASNNEGKIKQFKNILKDYKIIPLNEYNIDADIEENGETFLENAIIKAKTVSKMLNGKLCIADDSGIEIEYLNRFPGVNTKRWLKGTDRDRNLEIIKKLEGVSKEKRKVKFIVAIAVCNDNNIITSVSHTDGYIAEYPRGENGFGFDEIFELENGKTLAELSNKEREKISIRRKALNEIKEKLS